MQMVHSLKETCVAIMVSELNSARNVRFGLLITTLGGFLFTFDLPLLRLADGERWTLVFARGIFLFLSISAVWLFVRMRSSSKIPYLSGKAGLAVVATNTVANIAYIGALRETDAANVVFILALVPVLTAMFSRLFIGEKVHPYTWAATLMAFVGVAIIMWNGLTAGHVAGDLMALLCASCTAAAFTIIRASGRNVSTSLALGSLVSALVAWFFFPVSVASLSHAAGFGLPSWVWVALNGLVVIPLASSLIANGPRFLPSADVSMFFLLETVLTPLWVWLIFNEVPASGVVLGGAIVIAALVSHSFWRLRQTLKVA